MTSSNGKSSRREIRISSLSVGISLSVIATSSYAAISVFLAPIGYSWVQLGFSECLSPLPYLLGLSAVIVLTLGCFVTHWSSSVGLPKVLIGPLLILLASIMSWKFNLDRGELACACSVVLSAFGISAYVSPF